VFDYDCEVPHLAMHRFLHSQFGRLFASPSADAVETGAQLNALREEENGVRAMLRLPSVPVVLDIKPGPLTAIESRTLNHRLSLIREAIASLARPGTDSDCDLESPG